LGTCAADRVPSRAVREWHLTCQAGSLSGIEKKHEIRNSSGSELLVVFSSTLHGFFWFFLNACIFWYYLSKPLTSLSCPLNAVFPGLKMWDTFAFHCLDLKADPGHRVWLITRVNTDSPTSSLHRLLATAIFFIQLYSAIAVLAMCPRTQGYRKMPLFHTKRRSGRDWESNPGHLLGRQRL
jgi:hypothetical protein